MIADSILNNSAMSSDSDDKVPASNDEEKSSGSGATSEDYEMVKDSSPSPEGESRLVVTDQGSMEESLKEAVLEDTGAKAETLDLGTVINNENLLEDPDHTIFHNVFYLGSVRVDNPKDEAVIQENMQAMFDNVF